MEYCCHLWAGAPSYYLELLDKLQKRICRTVGLSLAASLGPLAHRGNAASLSLFYIYITSVDVLQKWLNWFDFLFLEVGLLFFFYGLHDFSITILRCYKDVYVNSFFPRPARLWNSLPIEWFPLIYFSGFKSRINRHHLTVGSFWTDFLDAVIFFVLLFLVTSCLVVTFQPCMEWIPIKKTWFVKGGGPWQYSRRTEPAWTSLNALWANSSICVWRTLVARLLESVICGPVLKNVGERSMADHYHCVNLHCVK